MKQDGKYKNKTINIKKNIGYYLTDTYQLACHGTYANIAKAKNYAHSLQELGLCKTFNIGTYINGKFEIIYSSN